MDKAIKMAEKQSESPEPWHGDINVMSIYRELGDDGQQSVFELVVEEIIRRSPDRVLKMVVEEHLWVDEEDFEGGEQDD